MIEFAAAAVIIILFLTGYIVSTYALAVYIDPDEVEKLLPNVSHSHREFLKKLADDPRALTQVAIIYKSVVLIATTLLSVRLLDLISSTVGVSRFAVYPVGLIILWLLYIVSVEFLPRRSSRKAVNIRMTRYIWIISTLYVLLTPVVRLYRRGLKKTGQEQPVSEEEKEEIVERAIETLAEEAGIGESIVEENEKEMIGQIFLLDQTVVREIMVPRMDIVGIEKGMSFKDIRELIARDGHSRYPVYEGTIDKIIGLVYVKDLFNRMPEPGERFFISDHLRKPFFVPQSKIIGELLHEFQTKHLHIAIAVDEYGGVAGLVTLEDIIEEIFGEIEDEHDFEKADVTRLQEGGFLVSASLMVEKLQDLFDTDYPQADYDTVGGLIYDLVGSVPSEGQKIRWNDLEFEVDKVEGQRILAVKVRK
ncbi:MAG: hemolysin family protein [candidate division Zixibacteria bacterium]|nr:hemolysin family protein [candidate division Zixibacteria bacterium]